jgi:hypothetical protein
MKKFNLILYNIRKPFDEYNYIKMGGILSAIFLAFNFFVFFFLILIDLVSIGF